MKSTCSTYRPQGNTGLFDNEEAIEKLNDMGNPLAKLTEVMDFEMFSETLDNGLSKTRLTNAGAKPYDPVPFFSASLSKLPLAFSSYSRYWCYRG